MNTYDDINPYLSVPLFLKFHEIDQLSGLSLKILKRIQFHDFYYWQRFFFFPFNFFPFFRIGLNVKGKIVGHALHPCSLISHNLISKRLKIMDSIYIHCQLYFFIEKCFANSVYFPIEQFLLYRICFHFIILSSPSLSVTSIDFYHDKSRGALELGPIHRSYFIYSQFSCG